ncbi:hypothetical protein Nepgr_000756 [Nepenthes gracilis]|uniref:FAD synthase n=1 Tax=Nepenthes gracilis TaxID=150966 RepID=A0AAD3P488_NEPGR|nr:hypothetical protein Nepgr_000756 [Nepenthes gracilis]
MMSGYRATQNMGEWDSLGFCSKLKLSSLIKLSARKNHKLHLQRRRLLTFSSRFALPLFSCLQSDSHGGLSVLSDSFSRKEDDHKLPSDGLTAVSGGLVALGKFDALHIGHRELAIKASKVGTPFLLSFVGMAEVLGWEPRAPIVAKCDRRRVLSSWTPYCGNITPTEVLLEFSSVRHLTPRQFVEKLSKELGVCGVVAGENYRFGYKAAGDATDLVRLCNEYGIGAYIIDSVMDKNRESKISWAEDRKERGQVSSTRVRYALANGDMDYVSQLLGRRHRVLLSVENKEGIISTKQRICAPKSCLLNLPPKDGLYDNCSFITGDGTQLPCTVNVNATSILLESDYLDHCIDVGSQDFRVLAIEFGDAEV